MTKQNLIKLMQKNGYFHKKNVRSGVNGFPDSEFLKDGKTIFIEFKKDKDTLSELQKYWINWLNKNQFTSFCYHEENSIIFPEDYYLELGFNIKNK